MRSFVRAFRRISGWMFFISGTILFVMMMITVTDVVMRYFGKPIIGSYELVSLIGATVIGFAIPKTSLDRGHVYVDILLVKVSPIVRRNVFTLTRIPCIALFFGLMIYLINKGFALQKAGQVSSILQIPHHYLVFILAFCCLIECFVLVADIFQGVDNKGEA